MSLMSKRPLSSGGSGAWVQVQEREGVKGEVLQGRSGALLDIKGL